MAENYGLQALIEAGADAQTNMYDVSLEFADWYKIFKSKNRTEL